MDGALDVWTRRRFMNALLVAGLTGCRNPRSVGADSAERFVCPPCDCDLNDVVYAEPGVCPACGMLLTPQREATLGPAPARLPFGAGMFPMAGHGAQIEVHFYRPPSFTVDSPIAEMRA